MDAKTARKYRRLGRVPSELPAAPRWRTRPDPFIDVWDDVQKLLEVNAGLEAKTVFEYLAAARPWALRGRAVAHVAAAGEELAGDRRSGQGSVLRAATPAGAAGSVGLHAHGRAGRDHPGAEFSAPDLSLRADVLELGGGDGVLFGELREPERRVAERGVGTGQSAAPASHRSAVDGGQQHERSGGVHGSLPGSAALLRTGGGEDAGRAWERERRCGAAAPSLQTGGGAGADAARQPGLWQRGRVPAVSAGDVRALERRAQAAAGGRDGGDEGVAGTAHGIVQARAGEGGLGQPDLCGPQRVLGAEPVDRRAGGGAAVHGPGGGLVRAEEGRKRCRGCAGGGSIAWITGTSSTGWCASRAPSSTTGTATSCFRPAGSAWPSICLRRAWPVSGQQGIPEDPGVGGQGQRGQSRRGVACPAGRRRGADQRPGDRGHAGSRAQHDRPRCARWRRWTSGSSTSCAVRGRCCNERGPSDQNGVDWRT